VSRRDRAERRVAIVLPAPAPYREGLLTALARRPGCALQVIYVTGEQPSWDAGPGWFPVAHPYPSRTLRAWQRPRPGRTPIQLPRGLGPALHAADADCVVASEYGAASLAALAWCRARGRAHVVLTECTPEIDPLLSAPQLRLHRWVARHTDGVIAVSALGRERLRRFGVADERITVSTQPAEVGPIRAARDAAADRRGAGGPVVVLAVARLVPDKNLATLIEAVAELDPAGERVALQIAGTGFQEEELRGLARRRGVPVRFLGALTAPQLAERYARADVFALVSTFEPFGVAVREAVAAGLPIVCSERAGAAGEVALAGRNALLVTPEDRPAIVGALGRLVDDPGLRARMGAESRAIDAAHEGRDVEAFANAIAVAAARRGR
jgi:glycosyltransferase involved in cell wall biosynthesis